MIRLLIFRFEQKVTRSIDSRDLTSQITSLDRDKIEEQWSVVDPAISRGYVKRKDDTEDAEWIRH